MNTIPAPLSAIKRDWSRLNLRQIPIVRMGPPAVRNLFARLLSLRTRLHRCRRITSIQARSLRAKLLRSLFAGWRTVVRKAAQTPHLRHVTIEHVLDLARDTHVLHANDWVPRILFMDPTLFQGLIPQANMSAPFSAQGNIQDPF